MTGISPFQRTLRVRKALRDVFLVVAALALLGAQALSTLHYVLVPHHLCALHGVLEDGTARASSAAAEHDGARDTAQADDGQQDVHDACSVATRSEHGALFERPSLTCTRLDGAFVAAASTGIWLAPDRAALLSSAPKTSPPTRA